MTLTAENVRVGVTGGAYHAPVGSTLPADAAEALDSAFTDGDVGYISEDGVTQTIETDSEDIKAWQNGDVVRKVQTSHDYTVQFVMIETTGSNLGLYYSDPDATDTSVVVTGAQPTREAWVLDVQDGDAWVRVVMPSAQVTDRGDVTYKNDEAIGYDITITAYPDENGVKAYIYLIPAGSDSGS